MAVMPTGEMFLEELKRWERNRIYQQEHRFFAWQDGLAMFTGADDHEAVTVAMDPAIANEHLGRRVRITVELIDE